jgi:hypothetical protein
MDSSNIRTDGPAREKTLERPRQNMVPKPVLDLILFILGVILMFVLAFFSYSMSKGDTYLRLLNMSGIACGLITGLICMPASVRLKEADWHIRRHFPEFGGKLGYFSLLALRSSSTFWDLIRSLPWEQVGLSCQQIRKDHLLAVGLPIAIFLAITWLFLISKSYSNFIVFFWMGFITVRLLDDWLWWRHLPK